MRPSISRLILPIYPDLINHKTTMHVPMLGLEARTSYASHRLTLWLLMRLSSHTRCWKRPKICGLTTSVHFITHEASERCRDELLSPENGHEVAILLHLATMLHGMG